MSRFRLMTLLPEMGFDVFGNPSLIHRSNPHIGCKVVPDNPDIQVAGFRHRCDSLYSAQQLQFHPIA